ncbi:hypothetical protein BGZ54_006148 [Gamsiella multidivaricata]|nr:hypothetical protein BGZ54_006148 [Gamsiella multidivaricata]
MATEKKSSARAELLRITKKHQKRGKQWNFLALGLRFQTNPLLPLLPSPISSPSLTAISTTEPPITSIASDRSSAAPKQIQLTQDALSDLSNVLEKDSDSTLITADELRRLKTCSHALLTAAYQCLYMATKTSCMSEESSWIGSGMARTGTNRSTFLERDWTNGRLYYEAHYIFRLGLEDMVAFMKTEPTIVKLHALFEQPMKDLKLESDTHVK